MNCLLFHEKVFIFVVIATTAEPPAISRLHTQDSHSGFTLRIWDAKSSPRPLAPINTCALLVSRPQTTCHPGWRSVAMAGLGRGTGRSGGLFAYLFEESDDILTDL